MFSEFKLHAPVGNYLFQVASYMAFSKKYAKEATFGDRDFVLFKVITRVEALGQGTPPSRPWQRCALSECFYSSYDLL